MAAPNSNYDAHIFSFLAPMAQKWKKDFLGTPQTPAEGAPSALPWMFLVALLTCSFLLLYLVPTAHAAGGGRIAGQLLDGTRKNAPVVGQSVTLQMAQGNTSQDLSTVKTDAHGAYTFSNLAT